MNNNRMSWLLYILRSELKVGSSFSYDLRIQSPKLLVYHILLKEVGTARLPASAYKLLREPQGIAVKRSRQSCIQVLYIYYMISHFGCSGVAISRPNNFLHGLWTFLRLQNPSDISAFMFITTSYQNQSSLLSIAEHKCSAAEAADPLSERYRFTWEWWTD